MYDIIVIGSGPAGLTAAIYGSRANKKVGILSGMQPGGQLMQTTHVENFPGFAQPILGMDLMNAMQEQVKSLDAEFISDELIGFEKTEPCFELKTHGGILKAKSVIIATGASARWLGIEKEFVGYGISSCATCDGSFFKNKVVAVVGGGDSAFEEAVYLSNIAKKVYLIHRRNEFRAEDIMQKRLFNKKNVELLTPFKVNSFYGETRRLQGAQIESCETQKIENLELDGAFIAIGHIPNTSFVKGILDLDENGYIKDEITTKTKGMFVAGDVFDTKYRQAITAAGFGCMAALEAIKFLED